MNKFKFQILYSVLFLIICSRMIQSCCLGVSCGPCMGNVADIKIELNIDSTKSNSYKIPELEGTLFLKIDTTHNKTDTLEYISSFSEGDPYPKFSFIIHNPEGVNYSNPYIYKVINDSLKLNILIDKIHIKGYFESGCCGCNVTDEFQFRVNNVSCNNNHFVINKP